MERNDRESVATFFVGDTALAPGITVTLSDAAARHARVLRLGPGARVSVLDGHGHVASGTLVRTAPACTIEVDEHRAVDRMPDLHVLVPIGDRDRMLLLAEKAAELSVTSWRPVLFRRSRSVKPKGEGQVFNGKVAARMTAALEQSGGAWLPTVYPEATLQRAISGLPEAGTRLVLDPRGVGMLRVPVSAPVTIAVGPEGGIEQDELELLTSAGFIPVALGTNILRFETAVVAGAALVRARLSEGTP